MSAMQRNKGARGEREFCAALSEHLGETLARQLGSVRDGGPDLILGDRWAIEIKRGETPKLATWWVQACQQADAIGLMPALAYRPNRQPWTVIIQLDSVLFGKYTWNATADYNLTWTAALSLPGFAAVVRETLPSKEATE
jgi:Holliday junction resolvase